MIWWLWSLSYFRNICVLYVHFHLSADVEEERVIVRALRWQGQVLNCRVTINREGRITCSLPLAWSEWPCPWLVDAFSIAPSRNPVSHWRRPKLGFSTSNYILTWTFIYFWSWAKFFGSKCPEFGLFCFTSPSREFLSWPALWIMSRILLEVLLIWGKENCRIILVSWQGSWRDDVFWKESSSRIVASLLAPEISLFWDSDSEIFARSH